jgi:hypothetical protein
MKKLDLLGAVRYHAEGKLFIADEGPFIVDDDVAAKLLDKFDDHTGYPYFEENKTDVKGKVPGSGDVVETPKVAPRARPRKRRPQRGAAAIKGEVLGTGEDSEAEATRSVDRGAVLAARARRQTGSDAANARADILDV